jgi:branched-chain amino acid transport system ATP-binding protein
MALLTVTDLQSGYGKLPVLHGLSFSVAEGEVVGIFGPNGAGKSTLAKTLFRLLAMKTGSIGFDGQDLHRLSAQQLCGKGLGYVPQDGNTFPSLTVEENLTVGLQGGCEGASRASAFGQIYELFPVLGERRQQRAGTLSGGERQMLAIAAAMIRRPRFLILDEPTSGLAPIVVDMLIAKMLRFVELGTTLLWIIGDEASKALRHVDRAYFLQSGLIAQELDASALRDESVVAHLYFGTADAPAEVRR